MVNPTLNKYECQVRLLHGKNSPPLVRRLKPCIRPISCPADPTESYCPFPPRHSTVQTGRHTGPTGRTMRKHQHRPAWQPKEVLENRPLHANSVISSFQRRSGHRRTIFGDNKCNLQDPYRGTTEAFVPVTKLSHMNNINPGYKINFQNFSFLLIYPHCFAITRQRRGPGKPFR